MFKAVAELRLTITFIILTLLTLVLLFSQAKTEAEDHTKSKMIRIHGVIHKCVPTE